MTLLQKTDSDGLLTFTQAATRLGISLRQFRRLIDSGKIPYVQVSERAPRVRCTAIEQFIEAVSVRHSEVTA
jgi:excisionase family DNA binding protein